MWNRPANWKWIVASIVLGPAAATVDTSAADGDLVSNTNKNRLTLRGRASFNISAKFTQSGRITPAGSPGGTGSALDHFYDDGYVRVDISGNAGGQTWFWGYDNASQISGNNILFHSRNAYEASSKDVNCDPLPGFDLVYNRQFGIFGKQDQHAWGIEASLGWTRIELGDKSALRARFSGITDSYSFVPGTTPPAAPFQGTFEGPNFVLNDTPTRTTGALPGGGIVRGSRQFDGDMFVGHLGPYADFTLSEKLLLSLSGGFAVGFMRSDLAFDDTLTYSGASPIRRRGSGSDSDVILGGFIGANLTYQFNPRWSANLGVQFEGLGDYTHSEREGKAKVDLGAAFHVAAGISYSF